MERHRFCVLEIQECVETYTMRKDQAEQSLETLKSAIKQQSLGDGGTLTLLADDQVIDLVHVFLCSTSLNSCFPVLHFI